MPSPTPRTSSRSSRIGAARRWRSRLLAIAAGGVIASSQGRAFAAEKTCWDWPPNDVHTLSLAKVVGRTYPEIRTDPGCSDPNCVIGNSRPGDLVIVAFRQGGLSCILDPEQAHVWGWAPSSSLQAVPFDRSPPLSAWTGYWWRKDDNIRFVAKGAHLVARGRAYFPNRRVSRQLGSFDGNARPRGNVVVIREEPCEVPMALIGPFLVTTELDPPSCGGFYAHFLRVFRRAER